MSQSCTVELYGIISYETLLHTIRLGQKGLIVTGIIEYYSKSSLLAEMFYKHRPIIKVRGLCQFLTVAD